MSNCFVALLQLAICIIWFVIGLNAEPGKFNGGDFFLSEISFGFFIIFAHEAVEDWGRKNG